MTKRDWIKFLIAMGELTAIVLGVIYVVRLLRAMGL